MKNLVNNVINDLNHQLDYVLNNTDFSSNYDDCLFESLQLYSNDQKVELIKQLADHFNLKLNDLTLEYFEYFLDHLDYGNFEVELRSVGYYNNMVENSCFYQLSIGEQEFSLFEEFENSKFKKGIIEYINNNTDFYIDSSNCAYINLTSYCLLYTCDRNYFIDCISSIHEYYTDYNFAGLTDNQIFNNYPHLTIEEIKKIKMVQLQILQGDQL